MKKKPTASRLGYSVLTLLSVSKRPGSKKAAVNNWEQSMLLVLSTIDFVLAEKLLSSVRQKW